ncbi:MAG: YeeE/YedE thiosulfate transporter family protein [Nitrospirota bacterium]
MPDDKSWSPYTAGALTGLVIILAAWLAGQYFGTTSTFVRAVGFIEQALTPERAAETDYFKRFIPKVDWQMMFVVGILAGSFISAVTSGSFRISAVPDMWKSRFGAGKFKRGLVAFIGGVFLMFGARLAGSCPSGYALGALVQLAVSGLLFVFCFFAGGIIFANILYRGGNK